MDEKYIQQIYDDMVRRYGAAKILPYNDFVTRITTDSSFQRNTYNDLAKRYGANKILSYGDFSGRVKKKDGGIAGTTTLPKSGSEAQSISPANTQVIEPAVRDNRFISFGQPVKPKPLVNKAGVPIGAVVNTETKNPDIKKAIDNSVDKYIKTLGVSKSDAERNIVAAYKNGDLIPIVDNRTGQAVMKRGGGLIESFDASVRQQDEIAKESDYLYNADKKTAIEYLNRTSKQPETSIVKERPTEPSGIGGEIGDFLGEQADMLAKGTVGAIGGGLSGVTGGASLGTFLSMVKGLAHGGYSQTLKKNYGLLKQQHPEMSDDEAYERANKSALVGEAVHLGTGAVLSGSLKMKLPEPTVPVTGVTNGILQSLKHTVKSSPKPIIASAAGSVATDIAGAAEGVKTDLNTVLKNATEAGKNMAVMHFGLGAMAAAANGLKSNIPSYTRPQFENVVASAPREDVKDFYQTAEDNGHLPQGTTDKVLKKLSEFDQQKKVVENLPLTEEQKAAITGKLLQRSALVSAKEDLHSYGDSFIVKQKDIDERIKELEADINGIYKSPNNVFRFERDNLTGEGFHNPKPFEELSKKEVEGIKGTKEFKQHGTTEITEHGDGENKTYTAKATFINNEGSLPTHDRIKIEGETKFTDKDKAQEAADNALAKHYYENGLSDNRKPAKSESKEEPQNIKSFSDRIRKGEKMTSPEDLQFYENNKTEIEKELKAKEPIKETVAGSDTNNEPIPAKESSDAETKPIEDVQPKQESKVTVIRPEDNNQPNIISPIKEDNFNSFKDKIHHMLLNQKGSEFDWRITEQTISQAEREKGVADIKAGKNTAAAKKVEKLVKDIYDSGSITLNRGRGNNAETITFTHEEWFGNPLSKEELNAIDKVDDATASIIKSEGITLNNIDNFKHLFDGFPYEESDFQAVKDYLAGQGERNDATKPISEESQRQEENIQSPIKQEQDALRVGKTEKIPLDASSTNSKEVGEGVPESGQTANAQIGGADEPPPNQEKVSGGESTSSTGGIIKEVNKERRRESGLPDYEPARETFSQWDEEGAKLLKEKYKGNVDNLLKELEDTNRARLPEENAILKNYVASVEAEIEKNPTPDLLSRRTRVAKLISGGSTEAARQLVSIKGIGEADNLTSFINDEATSLGVDPERLPQEILNHLKARYDAEKDLKQKVDEAYAKGRDDLLKEQAEAEFKKEQNKKNKTQNRDYKKELKTEFDKAREALRKIRTGESGITAVPLPAVRELIAIAPHVKNSMRILAEAGVNKLEEVVKQLHTQFKEVIDDLTQKDIYAILSGEYDNIKLVTKSQAAQDLKNMKEELKILNDIQNERLGIGKEKTLTQKVNKSRRIIDLQNKRKEVRKRRIQKDLEDEGVSEQSLDDPQKIKNKIVSLERGIKKLQDEYNAGKYKEGKRPPYQKVKLPPIAQALEDKYIQMKRQDAMRRSKYEYDKQSKWVKKFDHLYQILGLRRLIGAGIDFSIPFRQANPLTMNPMKWIPMMVNGEAKMNTIPKSFATMFNVSFSPKEFDRFQYKLETSELGRLFNDLGGVFSNPTEVKMDKREEEFTNNLFSRIGQKIELGSNEGLKKAADIANKIWFSERAAAGFLNTARIMEFEKAVRELDAKGYTPDHDPKVYKDAVKMIMNQTGRGNMLSALEDSHTGRILANRAYFGARLMSAKINMLNPVTYIRNSKAVNQRAFRDMAGTVSGYLITGAALMASGVQVSFDPNDPDFLQARFGDKVYDITGGSAAYVRTFLRVVEGVYKNIAHHGAKDTESYTRYMGNSVWKTMVANKLSPNTAYAYHFFTGKSGEYDDSGHLKDFNPYEVFQIYPMYADDLVKGLQEEGQFAWLTTFFPELFGVGFQRYGNDNSGSKLQMPKPNYHKPTVHKATVK